MTEQNQYLQIYFNGNKLADSTVLVESLYQETAEPIVIRAYNRAGKLGFEVEFNTDLITPVYEIPYTYLEVLHGSFSQYPIVNPTRLVLDYNNIEEYSLRYTPSPYQNVSNSGITLISKNEDKIGLDTYMQFDNLGSPASIATQHSITLPLYTQSLFGFQKSYYEVKAIGGSFTAENTFNTFTLDSDLLVELPSLMLHSYDGTTTRRRNIIRVIPAEDVQLVSGRRRFVAPYPIYISLLNKTEITLNSIHVRVLDGSNDRVLPILGEKSCSVTLTISHD